MAFIETRHKFPNCYFDVSSRFAERVLTVTVTGDLDMATTPYFLSSAESLLRCGPAVPTRVEVHLNEISFIGACGFRAINQLRQDAELLDVEFDIVDPSAVVARLLQILGREDLLESSVERNGLASRSA